MAETANHHPPPPPYKWANKEEYEHSDLDGEVQNLLTPQPDNIEEENIAKLFFKMMKSSKVGLVHFNDQTKEVNVYNKPSTLAVSEFSNGHFRYFKFFDDIRNRFSYIFNAEYRFGERGSNFYVSAFQKRQNFKYSFGYSKSLWQRLDNNYRSNSDELSFHTIHNNLKFANSLQFFILRESRQNYLNYYSKDAQMNHKLAVDGPEGELPKYSNLLAFKYIYKYDPFIVTGKFGVDFGNKSIFKSLNVFLGKNYTIGNSLIFKTSATCGKIWGRNLLKNDYFYGSNQSWMGEKFKNFISTRLQLLLLKYPYISLFKIYPHLYSQIWLSLGQRQRMRYDMKYFAEYGVGLSSAENGLKFDIALFNCSAEKKDGVLGAIKLSF